MGTRVNERIINLNIAAGGKDHDVRAADIVRRAQPFLFALFSQSEIVLF